MKVKLIFTLCFSVICSFFVQSQDNSTNLYDLSLEDLLNMEVVTVSKKAEQLMETPSVINVLTETEINNLNFNTLEEIIGYVAGVSSVTAEGNVFTTSTIRGNTLTNYNTNTLLLFNGTPIYNAYHGSFNLSAIPLSSVERIEVVKGSNSVLYGTNAINAVINIIPKQHKKGKAKSGAIDLRYGSFNTGRVSASHLLSKDDFSISLFGDGYYTSGQELDYYNESDGTTSEVQKKFSSVNMAAIARYKNWSYQFLFYNSTQNNIDENSLLPVLFADTPDTFALYWPQRTGEYQLVNSLSYNKELNDKFSLSINSTYQNWEMNKDEWSGKKDYSSWGLFNDAELNFTLAYNWNNKLGMSYNRYTGTRDRERIKNGIYQQYTDVEPDKEATNDFALYLNGNYRFSKKLNLHYGGRYYASNYNGITNDNFSPRLSLVYSLQHNLYIKAIYGNSFRVPTYFEKGSKISSIYGNDRLKPETSTSYDLVVIKAAKRFNWDLNLFYTEIDNKIARVIPNQADETYLGLKPKQLFKNTGSYTFYGLETNVKFNVNDKFNGFLNYSFVNADNNHDDPKLIGDDAWHYRHMIASGVHYRPVYTFAFTGSCKYLSEWGFGELNGQPYSAADPSFVANLGLNIYPLKEENLFFNIKADNLFGVKVYVPEIAGRNLDTAPVIPYNIGTKIYVSCSYRF